MKHCTTFLFMSCFLLGTLSAEGTRLLSTSSYPSSANADLGIKIRNTLQNNTGLTPSGRSIQVTVVDGKVTLSGTLNSTTEKSRVESIVKGVPGVKSVTNNIRIQSTK